MPFIKTVAAAIALTLPSVAGADTFILVHGAFQDARAWDSVADQIKAAGHDVVAIDLPGRNATGSEAQAMTLETYIGTVTQAVEAAGNDVVLVAHSFGGMTISAVAERVPDRIRRMIYVAAYVPKSGESMEALAMSDGDNGFTPQTFVIAPDYSYAEILAADQVRVFAQDADAAQAEQLIASMIREPLAPIGTPVTLTDAAFGSVAKAYVRTLEDRTVSTPLQTMMIARAGITDVRDIGTGHAPYLTDPDTLALHILELAR